MLSVRQYAIPVSPECSLTGTLDQSVTVKGGCRNLHPRGSPCCRLSQHLSCRDDGLPPTFIPVPGTTGSMQTLKGARSRSGEGPPPPSGSQPTSPRLLRAPK